MTLYKCLLSHECGEAVSVEFGGFDATHVTVSACSVAESVGVVSYEVSKSVAAAMLVAVESAGVVHKDGFVVMTGGSL